MKERMIPFVVVKENRKHTAEDVKAAETRVSDIYDAIRRLNNDPDFDGKIEKEIANLCKDDVVFIRPSAIIMIAPNDSEWYKGEVPATSLISTSNGRTIPVIGYASTFVNL